MTFDNDIQFFNEDFPNEFSKLTAEKELLKRRLEYSDAYCEALENNCEELQQHSKNLEKELNDSLVSFEDEDTQIIEIPRLIESISKQEHYLKAEFGPDIIVARSNITPDIVKVFKPGGLASSKPYQIAEGEFRVVTFVKNGVTLHEATFIESTSFLKKRFKRSFWSRLCFWRKG